MDGNRQDSTKRTMQYLTDVCFLLIVCVFSAGQLQFNAMLSRGEVTTLSAGGVLPLLLLGFLSVWLCLIVLSFWRAVCPGLDAPPHRRGVSAVSGAIACLSLILFVRESLSYMSSG